MKEPLFSFDMYEDIKQLKNLGSKVVLDQVKELIKEMERQNK